MITFTKKDIAKIFSMRYWLSRALGPGKKGWFDNEPSVKNCFLKYTVMMDGENMCT